MIELTKKAARRIRELQSEKGGAGKLLRLAVEKGGCSGMEYGMDFGEAKENDVALESEGIRFLVDPESFSHLDGSKVDFDDGLSGKGFEIHNPNAKSTCGCGKSFS